MSLRPKLSYANVVATLALILVVGGGTVYAAARIGKNDVKSKNIAKGAVKSADLGKNAVTAEKLRDGAVTSSKLQDGTITGADLAAGVIPQIQADVTGSATAGPQNGLTTAVPAPLPLTGDTTFTPRAGEVAALTAEGQFTLATTAATSCQADVRLLVNGEPTVFVSSDSTVSTTPVTSVGRDADGPFGLLNPDVPLTITAELQGDADCTAASQLDRLEVRIVQIK